MEGAFLDVIVNVFFFELFELFVLGLLPDLGPFDHISLVALNLAHVPLALVHGDLGLELQRVQLLILLHLQVGLSDLFLLFLLLLPQFVQCLPSLLPLRSYLHSVVQLVADGVDLGHKSVPDLRRLHHRLIPLHRLGQPRVHIFLLSYLPGG